MRRQHLLLHLLRTERGEFWVGGSQVGLAESCRRLGPGWAELSHSRPGHDIHQRQRNEVTNGHRVLVYQLMERGVEGCGARLGRAEPGGARPS